MLHAGCCVHAPLPHYTALSPGNLRGRAAGHVRPADALPLPPACRVGVGVCGWVLCPTFPRVPTASLSTQPCGQPGASQNSDAARALRRPYPHPYHHTAPASTHPAPPGPPGSPRAPPRTRGSPLWGWCLWVSGEEIPVKM